MSGENQDPNAVDPTRNMGADTAAQAADGTVETNAPPTTTPDPNVANSVPAASSEGSSTQSSNSGNSVGGGLGDFQFDGIDLYDAIAKLSIFNSIESVKFSDGYNRKIDCFFVDKFNLTQEGCFHYIYGREVKSISINHTISSFGTTGSIEINDTNGSLTTIVERANNFYFVISVYNTANEDRIGNSSGFMPQPYVFDVEDITVKSPDGFPSKIYQLTLIDVISGALKKVSYGNFLLEYPAFVNSNNFVELYLSIIEYAAKIIYFSHNKQYKIDNKIYFVDDIADSINEFLKSVILKDLPISMTCFQLLNYIYKHAAKEIKIPSHFEGDNPGNVLIPLFLQEEIEDISSSYRTFFKRQVSKEITDKLSFPSKAGAPFSVEATLIRKGLYARNLLMPFELAFNDGQMASKSIIYENINPFVDEKFNILESEQIYSPSNGIVISPLEDTVDIPPDASITGFGWKNLALIADTPSGGSNMLIYFNWIYEFYKAVFLNDKNSILKSKLQKFIVPANDPHFHMLETSNLTGGDAESFAKINANTIVLKSTDTLKEALYHVGRSLKSYVMLNSLFGFKIKGDILRHPGEIIKINSSVKSIEDESPAGVVGGAEATVNKFVLAFTNSVTHLFNGNQFKDLIYATKICVIEGKDYQKSLTDNAVGDSTTQNNTSNTSSGSNSQPATNTAPTDTSTTSSTT